MTGETVNAYARSKFQLLCNDLCYFGAANQLQSVSCI